MTVYYYTAMIEARKMVHDSKNKQIMHSNWRRLIYLTFFWIKGTKRILLVHIINIMRDIIV